MDMKNLRHRTGKSEKLFSYKVIKNRVGLQCRCVQLASYLTLPCLHMGRWKVFRDPGDIRGVESNQSSPVTVRNKPDHEEEIKISTHW